MKTFEDLVFKVSEDTPGLTRASLSFDNGYGISVISGYGAYGDGNHPYEIAVLDKEGNLTYSTKVTNDVIGYCTEKDVSRYMKMIQELPSA